MLETIRRLLKYSPGTQAKSNMYKIYATSGGHGSSFLTEALRKTGRKVHIRPDVAFEFDKTLDDFPDKKSVKEFRKRSRYTLDVSKTINDNLVLYLDSVYRNNEITVLGRASRLGLFLTKNGIKNAICLVRHPLHAYISFVGHQHPEAGQQFGELSSERRIRWYAEQWNLMVSDYLNSGNKIIRYEFMNEDVKDVFSPNLPELLKNWTTSKRNHRVLDKEKEHFLRELVATNFYQVYNDWDF